MTVPGATRPSSRPVPAATRCGIALLSAGAGVGTGHLVGGLVSPGSAPVLAVADRVVDAVPPAVAELAIATLGTADKIVLLAAVLVVTVAVALLAGALSRRDERHGTAVLAVLGGLGLLAVLTGPAFGPLDLLAPAAALVVAVWTWRALYRLARRAVRAPAGPDTSGPDTSRRRLLIASAAAGAGAVVTGAAGTALGAGLSAAGGTPASRAAVTARLAGAPVRRAPALP